MNEHDGTTTTSSPHAPCTATLSTGKNCYYSGKAGCGKSHLLRAIIARAPAGKTFVTASTGIAAISIGGTTLHSFAGERGCDCMYH